MTLGKAFRFVFHYGSLCLLIGVLFDHQQAMSDGVKAETRSCFILFIFWKRGRGGRWHFD